MADPFVEPYTIEGALKQIPEQRGGVAGAMSEVTKGRKATGRFLFSGTVELLEALGFERVRHVGELAWIVAKGVSPA